MATIYPFRALRFRPEKAGVPLENLVTQPYDKITPEMQERYYALSPHNLITLELGRREPATDSNNVYTRAAKWLDDTIKAGVLAPDPEPSIYVYFQEYAVPGTKDRRTRKGFIALGKIEDYEAGVVHRHEQTLSGPKADRLELLRHTHAHTGQLFMIYSDPAHEMEKLLKEVAQREKPEEITDEYGAIHRLWRVSDPATISRFQQIMADKKLIIADGHHRYETALAYRNECRQKTGRSDPDAPHEKVMMTFVHIEQPGVTILPGHRVVSNVEGFHFQTFRDKASENFDWYAYPGADGAAKLLRDLAERGAERPCFGVVAAREPTPYLFLLKVNADLAKLLPNVSARQRRLDLVVLHKLLLDRCLGISEEAVRAGKHLRYLRSAEEAAALVHRGDAQIAFLVNPVRAELVCEIALAGEVLPQKSTDFYPKMLSGLTIYRLDT
ncbi:MAG TPA: DUF1015 domain-containing protein [Candidatus Xenobia bacterium]|nr:DUF1015 domain-containing protein [Candidatus Xenobia bacterium]